MNQEIKALETALCQPFAASAIHFKPMRPRQNPQTKRWECLALPYADKRVYEDHLNHVAFGAWSTPSTIPVVAGNKLIIPVTVVIWEVSHTDFGEAFLSSQTRKGETREEENSATEAYSQGFRRACSQFGVGRYLYQLPKLWLPYDPDARVLAIKEAERVAWVEKLYLEAGLSARPTPTGAIPATRPNQQAQPAQASQPLVDEKLLAHLRASLTASQVKKACSFYHVASLDQLSMTQAVRLSESIEARTRTEASRDTEGV